MGFDLYFNEFDPFTAKWLKRLYPDSVVDRRSIVDVRPTDLCGYRRCHFFGGIGGWQYALQLANWPKSQVVWTGSCPCQPFSNAGKRNCEKDKRHLWPEFLRLIKECRPPTVFGEQVTSKLGREWLARVRSDLEVLGYAVGAADLCAASVGAPHIRQRLFWVADAVSKQVNATGSRLQSESGYGRRMGNPNSTRSQRRSLDIGEREDQFTAWATSNVVHCTDGKARRFEPGSFPLAYGVSQRVGRLRGYGNAIVPQVAAVFIKSFLEAESI